MLALDRRKDETIFVDGPCKIVVIHTSPSRVRLGIIADSDVLIQRGELGPIQESNDGLIDLGRRASDANDAALESRMIDHG